MCRTLEIENRKGNQKDNRVPGNESKYSKTEKKMKIALISNRLCTEELGGTTEFLKNHKITLIVAEQQVGDSD